MKKLSEKETILLQLIEHSTMEVTLARIENELGKEYIGALGKLLRLEKIEKASKCIRDTSSPYSRRINYYIVKGIKMEQIILDKIQIGISQRISKELLNNMDIEVYLDHISDNITCQLRGFIAGQTLEDIRYPINWYESFRERFYPKFWLSKYPIKYKVIKIKALYPKIALPKEKYTIVKDEFGG